MTFLGIIAKAYTRFREVESCLKSRKTLLGWIAIDMSFEFEFLVYSEGTMLEILQTWNMLLYECLLPMRITGNAFINSDQRGETSQYCI